MSFQTEQGKEGKNMWGKKMRQEELKEYRAGFCRSVGLIYGFTTFLAYKHPWNEEPVLLSLLYTPASTTSGKSAQQQNLKPAVGPGRRWFSVRKVNHMGFGYACSLPAFQRRRRRRRRQQPSEWFALLWAHGQGRIHALQSETICKGSNAQRSPP